MKKKKVMKLAYLLMGVALLLSSCSEDLLTGGSDSNEDVTISLAYSDVSPRDIVVNSRSKTQEERHLDNLYIYIFDGNGNLKGYKGIEGEDNLNQNTSSSEKEEITGIKTRSGDSYIYAVANISTGLYPVATSNGTVEPNKLPINLDEDKARAGEYEFTLDQLKALTFNRNNRNTIQISSAFLMSGAVQQGNLVNITPAGTIENGGNDIRLSRIVSKVKFTIKEKTGDGVTRSFKLDNYSIMNIAMKGTLIGNIDGNDKKSINNDTDVSNIVGQTLSVNDVDETGAEYFKAYLPENLQEPKQSINVQAMREDDSKSIPKVFTNAPDYGTYVVLKGKYEETKDGSTKTANVTYYVHLGDCSVNYNDYNVERNCKYTFNITVAGVNKIIVEAKKEGNEQPGAEGVVMEYGNMGKNLTLDSHYEYMVMRFERKHIQNLKKYNLGYYYQVYALGKKTDPINVKDEANTQEHQQQRNGVDTNWIEFAITGRAGSKSSYGNENGGRGIPCDYPGNKHTMDIETFLKMLYVNADNDSFWTNGEYIDATCFVSENYYSNLRWDQYVNDVDKRAFYVASYVWVSKDTRSVYAKAQYGLTQHNIQTFYDRSQAGNVTAYGCETINDEEKPDGSDTGFDINDQIEGSNGNDLWDGRYNMKKDIFDKYGKPVKTWDELKRNISLRIACMSRNRDLNGDGIISDDEIRWYAPATQQYAGLWIGEEIMSTESKLFKKSTKTLKSNDDRMVYYSSTRDAESFLSEEGMSTGNYNDRNSPYRPKYVRCVRNLKSGEIGYAQKPDRYYSYARGTRTVTLDKVDHDALNITGEQGELFNHTERDEGNKPAKKFTIATNIWTGYYNYKGTTMKPLAENVYTGKYWCYGRYSENGKKNWRVPNQREFCIMTMVATDDPSCDVKWTACRTQFSNPNFFNKKSWTCNYIDDPNSQLKGVITMSLKNVWGVRCIKVLKD
ncbi:MAG: DUF4906 domain-containing protein [Prevotella copri]|nr:DUF4906 domain-containing protein [Segatella copri]